MKLDQLNKSIGTLGIRLLIGTIFAMQGYGKVFSFGVGNVYASFFQESFKNSWIPVIMLKFTAYYTSYIELVGGILLVLGIFKHYSCYALLSVLIIVTYGHGLIEPIWNMEHVIYRSVLLIPLFFIPTKWDVFSLDYLRTKKT